MSELKAFDIVVAEEYYFEGIVKYRRAVYDKSEADKVIVEKYRQLRHSNYKRCLAMARWCHNQREIYERDSYNWELDADAVASLRNKANIMRKWHKRWLELAEKFKEVK